MTDIQELRVLIVGFGSIGYRHFQGLGLSQHSVSVDVIDPIQERNLLLEKEPLDSGYDKIRFFESIDSIENSTYHLCILSTISGIRYEALNKLMDKINCHNYLLEKVVFVTTAEYEKSMTRLESLGINCWVNTSKRYFPVFNFVREQFIKNECHNLRLHIQGGNVGLGCNSFHFLDLVKFITKEKLIDIKFDRCKIHESSRKGYYELSGQLIADYDRGSSLLFYSQPDPIPWGITITADRFNIVITDRGEVLRLCSKDTQFKWREYKFKEPFQSELTGTILDEIYGAKSCQLANLDTAFDIDRIFLPKCQIEIERLLGKTLDFCPIT